MSNLHVRGSSRVESNTIGGTAAVRLSTNEVANYTDTTIISLTDQVIGRYTIPITGQFNVDSEFQWYLEGATNTDWDSENTSFDMTIRGKLFIRTASGVLIDSDTTTGLRSVTVNGTTVSGTDASQFFVDQNPFAGSTQRRNVLRWRIGKNFTNVTGQDTFTLGIRAELVFNMTTSNRVNFTGFDRIGQDPIVTNGVTDNFWVETDTDSVGSTSFVASDDLMMFNLRALGGDGALIDSIKEFEGFETAPTGVFTPGSVHEVRVRWDTEGINTGTALVTVPQGFLSGNVTLVSDSDLAIRTNILFPTFDMNLHTFFDRKGRAVGYLHYFGSVETNGLSFGVVLRSHGVYSSFQITDVYRLFSYERSA